MENDIQRIRKIYTLPSYFEGLTICEMDLYTNTNLLINNMADEIEDLRRKLKAAQSLAKDDILKTSDDDYHYMSEFFENHRENIHDAKDYDPRVDGDTFGL